MNDHSSPVLNGSPSERVKAALRSILGLVCSLKKLQFSAIFNIV